MTQPITITTRQTEELIRAWSKSRKANQTLNIILLIGWSFVGIFRIIMGLARPEDWMNWINAALAMIIAVLYFTIFIDPAWFHLSATTTLTLTDSAAQISIDQNGKTRGYLVDWSKVRIQETDQYYVFQANWHQMQIFCKEDLTDCTVEELSALLQEKIGNRYVKL